MKSPQAAKLVPAMSSPQRQVPEAVSPRCKRSQCQGSICANWRFCSPSTAFASSTFTLKERIKAG